MSKQHPKGRTKPPQITREEFEQRLEKALADDPAAPIDAIVNKVKQDLILPKQTSDGWDPSSKRPGWLKWGLGVLLAVLVLGGVVIVAFRWVQRDNPEEPEPTAIFEAAGIPDHLQFGQNTPTDVKPGDRIALEISAYDAAGALVPGAVIDVRDDPAVGTFESSGPSTDGWRYVYIVGDSDKPVELVAQLQDNPDVHLRHLLKIVAQPALIVSFKDDSPTDELLPVNEQFTVIFQVSNNGQAPAQNVKMRIKTPAGLQFVRSDVGCVAADEGSIECAFGDMFGGGSGTKSIIYVAHAAATVNFARESYSVTYNGGPAPILGNKEHTISIEEPRAAAIEIDLPMPELAADGVTMTGLTVNLLDQWGQPFQGSADVELTIVPALGIGGTASAGDSVKEVECSVLIAVSFGVQGNEGDGSSLFEGTPIKAIAYDPAKTQLYIRVLNDGREGWVPMATGDGQSVFSCADDALSTLPAVPPEAPAELPLGQIWPSTRQTAQGGSVTFTYQAGTEPGDVNLSAQLFDDAGEPVGEPKTVVITALEAGQLKGSAHISSDPSNLTGDDDKVLILLSLPGTTPLELYPPDDNAPTARRVAIRVWLSAGSVVVDDAGQTRLVDPGTARIYVSTDLAQLKTMSSTNGPAQTLGGGAAGYPVAVLDESDDYVLVRLEGWVREGALAGEE